MNGLIKSSSNIWLLVYWIGWLSSTCTDLTVCADFDHGSYAKIGHFKQFKRRGYAGSLGWYCLGAYRANSRALNSGLLERCSYT